MSGDSHAKPADSTGKTSETIYAIIGKIVVVIFIIWLGFFILGKLLQQPTVINNYYGKEPTPATQPDSLTMPPPTLAQPRAAPNITQPSDSSFQNVLGECHPGDLMESRCAFDPRGSYPIGATHGGMYLHYAMADGSPLLAHLQRWDPDSQKWYDWNPCTDQRVVAWQRFAYNDGVLARQLVVKYQLSDVNDCR